MLLDRFEPKIEGLEEAYRQDYLKSDSEQVFTFVSLTMLANTIFSAVETWLYFSTPEAFALLSLRITFLIFSLVV